MKEISEDLMQGSVQRTEAQRKIDTDFKNVILVGSGKGGVGKSLVASVIALSLARRGIRTALLDLDIHGASLPLYFELSGPLKSGKEGLEPKSVQTLKVMSLGLFVGNRPVPLRGGVSKESLIIDLIALTHWGSLDYLVVDLPPGLGDEVLTAFSLFGKKGRLILVTTPSPYATEVVSRLRELAENEEVTTKGIVVNMAYSPFGKKAKLYPFGKVKKADLEKSLKSKMLGEIPLNPKIATQGLPRVLSTHGDFSRSVNNLVEKIASSEGP